MSEQGVVLIGEAAVWWVALKWVEFFVLTGGAITLGYLIYRAWKRP